MATLNLHNPEGLYSGGSVSINAVPYAQMAMQARARKEAREQAIDNYYQKLPDTINDKGVRDQEVPVINEYKRKIYEYGVKNKEALRKGDGAAQLGLQQLFRDAQSATRESQDLGNRQLQRGKMYLTKEGQWAVDDDEFMAAEDAESQPAYIVENGNIVRNPSHKKMDMVSLLSNRPFDEKEFGKELQGKIKYGIDVVTTDDPNDPFSNIVSQVPSLNKDAKEQLYDFVSNKYNGNKRFRDFIQKATPEQLDIWYNSYKQKYGVDPKDDEDFAVGYATTQIPITSTKQKKERDVRAVMDKRADMSNAEWDRRNKITYQQSLNKIAANKAAGLVPEDLGYLSDNVAEEVGEAAVVNYGGKKEDKIIVYVDKVDPERLDIITGRDLSKKKTGVKPIAFKGGKMGYYVDPGTGDWEGAGGQKISREAVKDRYVQSKAGTKFKAQSGTKASENTNTPKVKTTTKSGLPVFHK